MNRIRFCFALFITCYFFLNISYAWNAMGHMVVAEIAYANLNSDVKNKIDYLVNVFNKEYADINTFSEIAFWPDAIRTQKIDLFARWHYIDNAFSKDGTPIKNLIDTDNAVWAFQHIMPVLQNNHANEFERARFLGFFVHIVGDLHQPLHTVSYVSGNHPNGDRGGNDYYILLNKNRIELHKLWDCGVNLFDSSTSGSIAKQFALKLMDLYPKSYFGNRVNDLNPESWIKEGLTNAIDDVYIVAEDQPAPISYEENGKELSEKEITLAGYRLAGLLNQLFY